MDPTRIGLFSLAEQRLAWTDRRQTLLAENIANADTPGWRPRDVLPFATLLSGAQRPLTPVQTEPGDMAGLPPEIATAQDSTGPTAPDGNGVQLDMQLSRVADTETTQRLTTDLYMKYLGFFRTALGR